MCVCVFVRIWSFSVGRMQVRPFNADKTLTRENDCIFRITLHISWLNAPTMSKREWYFSFKHMLSWMQFQWTSNCLGCNNFSPRRHGMSTNTHHSILVWFSKKLISRRVQHFMCRNCCALFYSIINHYTHILFR